MIKIILMGLFSTSLMLFISFESTYANQQEEQLIKQNKEAAKSSTNQAMFVVHRIKCINSNDRAALNACNRALSINPSDATLRNRKVLLTNRLYPRPKKRHLAKQPNRQAKKVVRNAPIPKKPYTRPVKKVAKTNAIAKKTKSVQNNSRKVVIQIQKSLNLLGFNVGLADGVAGKKTKKAIKDFQKLTNRKIRPNLDKKLQLALKNAQKQHAIANPNYQRAKQELSEGNLEETSLIIKQNLKIAPWHKELTALNIQLKERIAQKEENKKNEENRKNLAKAKAAKELALKTQIETDINLKRNETKKYIETARTQLDNKEMKSAVVTINKGLKLSPDNADLLSLLSDIQNLKEKQIELDQIVSDSQQMYLDGKLENSFSLIEKGLTLNPNHSGLLTLKSKISLKQEELQAQKEKDETLSILYARALNGFNNNEFDSASAFVEKGLSLDSQHLKLLELKSKISTHQTEFIAKKDKENKLTDLLNQSANSFNNNDLDIAIAQIDQGLSLEPDNLQLLELKAKVLTKQKGLEMQKQKDKKLASLFQLASDKLSNNKLGDAIEFVNEGLTLDSNNLNLLELKKDISLKQQELVIQEKTNQKIAMMLSLIEEKQNLLKTIDNKMIAEQQSFLNQAQQTLISSLSQ